MLKLNNLDFFIAFGKIWGPMYVILSFLKVNVDIFTNLFKFVLLFVLFLGIIETRTRFTDNAT